MEETLMSTTSVPALLRQQVDRWAETWLKAKFSRLLELRPVRGSLWRPSDGQTAWTSENFLLRRKTSRKLLLWRSDRRNVHSLKRMMRKKTSSFEVGWSAG